MTRKAKYPYWLSETGLSQIRQWLDEGIFHREIADKMGIHRVTLYQWARHNQNLHNVLYANRLVYSVEITEEEILNEYT